MKQKSHRCQLATCPVFPLIDILEKKWALKIIREIYNGTIRFNQLKRNLKGVTAAILVKRLRELEDAGLISRKVLRYSPSEIEYELGDGARQLMECWLIHKPSGKG